MNEEAINKLLQDVRKNIDSYDWHVLAVSCEDKPSFAYTIGLTESFGHPEIIMFGLNIKLMHALLNDLGRFIKEGQVFKEGQLLDKLLKDEFVKFVELCPWQISEYLRLAKLHYKDKPIKALQCLWADEDGNFPTDSQCSKDVGESQELSHPDS